MTPTIRRWLAYYRQHGRHRTTEMIRLQRMANRWHERKTA